MARLPTPPTMPIASAGRAVDIIIYPGVQPLDAVGPHEVFAGANQALDHLGRMGLRYVTLLRGSSRGPVTSESGLVLHAEGLARRPPHTLMIAGGSGALESRHDPSLRRWLERHGRHSQRITSVCSGAFVLAAAGLLDGRRATTHWSRAGQLAREHPDVLVDRDAIYVRDDDVWTSAGVTAGIDLALALVEDDHGADVAQLVARWLVVFLRRPGGQSQFATGVWHEADTTGPVQQALQLVHARPERPWTIRSLAHEVHVSERHLGRLFVDTIGITPAKFIERVRVEAARHLLETTDHGLDDVSRRCGFATSETLRRTFLRTLGVAPGAYRSRFGSPHRPSIPSTSK